MFSMTIEGAEHKCSCGRIFLNQHPVLVHFARIVWNEPFLRLSRKHANKNVLICLLNWRDINVHRKLLDSIQDRFITIHRQSSSDL